MERLDSRRKFFRDCLMACAVSLLPKILRPCEGVIEEDKDALFQWAMQNPGNEVDLGHWKFMWYTHPNLKYEI